MFRLINKVLDADPWADRFDELDFDKNGFLDKEDILAIAELNGIYDRWDHNILFFVIAMYLKRIYERQQ